MASAAAMPTLKWYLRAKMHGKWWGFHAQLLNICTGKGCAGGQGLKGFVGESEIMHGRLQQANAISMIAPAVRLRLRFYQHGAPQVRHTARPNDKTELLDNF